MKIQGTAKSLPITSLLTSSFSNIFLLKELLEPRICPKNSIDISFHAYIKQINRVDSGVIDSDAINRIELSNEQYTKTRKKPDAPHVRLETN